MTKPKPNSTRGNPVARFDSFTNFDGPVPGVLETPCWLWTGAAAHGGYAQFKTCIAGVRTAWAVHRYAYERHVGPIPEGFQVDHLCKVRNCVNPDHLEAVTPQENNLRSDSPSAINARRRECRNGHPLIPENLSTYRGRGAERRCRICATNATRERRQRKSA